MITNVRVRMISAFSHQGRLLSQLELMSSLSSSGTQRCALSVDAQGSVCVADAEDRSISCIRFVR